MIVNHIKSVGRHVLYDLLENFMNRLLLTFDLLYLTSIPIEAKYGNVLTIGNGYVSFM